MSHQETEQQRLEALEQLEIEKPEDFLPGTFGYHEAFHMASVMIDSTESHLLDHPAILLDANLYALASKAHLAFFELYQAMGDKHLADK
ncbi:hypothetical protein [Rhizobium straminoryzae]|uniref:Uncharacterized protein n=1 Tax=Rhizobium straminoryzae TaxID=1387186 RepID=A0A549T3F1_9HYPH|nr:hypothetical protein [Rhizobium straminoryzae]TRL36372.1 hypothetical protein FNA46_18170 [Rhizobium straminoryzae]